MAVPAQPEPPELVNDDARQPDSLTLTWTDVPDALSYNAQVTDEAGATVVHGNVPRPLVLGGLTPTEKYTIAIQAENADGVSPFSGDFSTRTRPETPGSPTIIQDAVMPVFLVKWNIAGPAGGFAVLRRIGSTTDQIVVPSGPLTGDQAFSSIPSGTTWQFLVRVVLSQGDMPGGVNESFWSPSSVMTTIEALSSSPSLRRSYGVILALRRGR